MTQQNSENNHQFSPNVVNKVVFVKDEIKAKIGNAKLKEAFLLIEENAGILNVSLKKIRPIKSTFMNNENMFLQNLITPEAYNQVFSKTVMRLQNMLNIEDSQISKNRNKGTYRMVLILFVSIGISLFLLLFSLWLFDLSINDQSETEIETLENYFVLMRNPRLSPEKMKEINRKISRNSSPEARVIVKAENGNIVNQLQLEYFLQEISFGLYENTYIERISTDSIIIRYN